MTARPAVPTLSGLSSDADATGEKSSPVVTVRPADRHDLDDIVRMRMALLAEEGRSPLFADPHPRAAARALRITEAQLRDDDQVFLLAVSQSHAVGMVRCTLTSGNPVVSDHLRGFLSAAYVSPAFRRLGVLRMLVDAAEEWCAERGTRDLRLHCTIENMEGNIAWDALGFKVVEVVRRRNRSR